MEATKGSFLICAAAPEGDARQAVLHGAVKLTFAGVFVLPVVSRGRDTKAARLLRPSKLAVRLGGGGEGGGRG